MHTGQHYDYEMDALLFEQLCLPQPDYNLGVGSGTQSAQLGNLFQALEPVLAFEMPDWVLVYGDTNSTLAGALMASRLGLRVAHIEAGCRSYVASMPEEQNRIITDHLSTLLLTASPAGNTNLLREGIGSPGDPRQRTVEFVGDLMLDVLLSSRNRLDETAKSLLPPLGLTPGGYYLLTLHRAENTASAELLLPILSALQSANLPVVFPVHPRTRRMLAQIDAASVVNLKQIPPLGYFEMLCAIKHSRRVITDSGGVQKEAFYLRLPCITLRRETEWPETVDAGLNTLVGMDPVALSQALANPPCLPADYPAPYGDGAASAKVLDLLLYASDTASRQLSIANSE